MNVITNTFVGLKCLTETKIQILYDHVDHTRFHIVEMGYQMVELLCAYIHGCRQGGGGGGGGRKGRPTP